MLLIIDEAQTALGRTGTMFGFEQEEIVPDIRTLAKPFGNGFPVSAVVVSRDIDKICRQRGFMFITSHVNDPLPASVADKVLEIVVRDDLVSVGRTRAAQVLMGIENLKRKHRSIGKILGRGLLLGVELLTEHFRDEHDIASKLQKTFVLHGLWINIQQTRRFPFVLKISPPIVISEEQIEDGIQVMGKALTSLEKEG